jgi:hypothetical protein
MIRVTPRCDMSDARGSTGRKVADPTFPSASSAASGLKPTACRPATAAPMLVPAIRSHGTPARYRHLSTPICAKPLALPAPSASPTHTCTRSRATPPMARPIAVPSGNIPVRIMATALRAVPGRPRPGRTAPLPAGPQTTPQPGTQGPVERGRQGRVKPAGPAGLPGVRIRLGVEHVGPESVSVPGQVVVPISGAT